MSSVMDAARSRVKSHEARKFIKYSAVSVIAVVITFFLILVLGLFGVRAFWASVIASTTASVPSYILNRSWVWGKSGRSHMMREVVPFWVMFGIGLAFSTLATTWTESLTNDSGKFARSIFVAGSSVLSYGVLWVLKYVIMNKLLFAHHEEDLDPVLDGRSGFPT